MTPRIIHNPVSGERIEFLRSDEELLEFELQLTPDGKGAGDARAPRGRRSASTCWRER